MPKTKTGDHLSFRPCRVDVVRDQQLPDRIVAGQRGQYVSKVQKIRGLKLWLRPQQFESQPAVPLLDLLRAT
jgi:hypothetical protein